MLRLVARHGALSAVASAALFTSLAGGCGSRVTIAETYDAAAPSFVSPDGAGGAADASFGIPYCPTSECAFGFTTCASSRFLCDTNLLTDTNNCGACGHACPAAGESYSFVCVEGQCVMKCAENPERFDCDGIADNGCETWPITDQHCGACNVTCDPSTDPTKACTSTVIKGKTVTQCGCPNGLMLCADCVDPNADDNCGTCGNVCDPNGGPQPNPPHMYYGCGNEQCGQLKCESGYLNCDANTTNGCEVFAVSDDNCGGCGEKCQDGTRCVQSPNGTPQCMCEPGTSLCVTRRDPRGFDVGYCADFSSDKDNCGGCGVRCAVTLLRGAGNEVCVHGSCELRCAVGTADCNDSPSDGCETNTASDPRNCGGCGIECDIAAGQACAGGRCMLAPCAPDEETAR